MMNVLNSITDEKVLKIVFIIIKNIIMKNFLLTLFTASFFVACKTDPGNNLAVKTDLVPVNTAGYNMSNASTDVAKAEDEDRYEVPARKKKTLVYSEAKKTAPVAAEAPKQEPAPQANQSPASSNAPVNNTNQQANTPETKPAETASGTSPGEVSKGSAGAGETSGTEEKQVKKKGWSNAAKGALIGGAAGAIGGAVINGRNRAVGAAIGAVLGAAGGYAIGRKKDKDKEKDAADNFSVAAN